MLIRPWNPKEKIFAVQNDYGCHWQFGSSQLCLSRASIPSHQVRYPQHGEAKVYLHGLAGYTCGSPLNGHVQPCWIAQNAFPRWTRHRVVTRHCGGTWRASKPLLSSFYSNVSMAAKLMSGSAASRCCRSMATWLSSMSFKTVHGICSCSTLCTSLYTSNSWSLRIYTNHIHNPQWHEVAKMCLNYHFSLLAISHQWIHFAKDQ